MVAPAVKAAAPKAQPLTLPSGDFYGLRYGQVILDLGPPKTGKSTFAGSVCEVVPPERVKLLLTMPNEVNSWAYRRYGLQDNAEVFVDSEWDPELGLYNANAYKRLVRRIKELAAQPADVRPHAYIIDSGTNVGILKGNEILSGMRAAGSNTPFSDTGDLRQKGSKDASYSYYGKVATELQRFMGRLVEIAIASPAFFIIPWHTQLQTEDEASDSGIMHQGKVLPMVEGKYRQKIAGDVDVLLYSDIRRSIRDGKPHMEYVVQLVPNGEKHAAVRSMAMTDVKEIPNSFGALHKLMVG